MHVFVFSLEFPELPGLLLSCLEILRIIVKIWWTFLWNMKFFQLKLPVQFLIKNVSMESAAWSRNLKKCILNLKWNSTILKYTFVCVYIFCGILILQKKWFFFFMKEYFFYKVMCVFEWCNSINDTAVSICQCTSKDKSVMNSSSQSATSVTEVVYNLCAILNSHFCSWRVCVQFLNFDTDIFYEYKLFVIR